MEKKRVSLYPESETPREQRTKTVAEILVEWLDATSAMTTMHGGNWVGRIQNVHLKVLLFISLEVVFWTVVALLAMSGLEFVADKSIQSTQVSSRVGNVRFPQMTICHPWYFERKAFIGMNP